jgi:hypothetical protein
MVAEKTFAVDQEFTIVKQAACVCITAQRFFLLSASAWEVFLPNMITFFLRLSNLSSCLIMLKFVIPAKAGIQAFSIFQGMDAHFPEGISSERGHDSFPIQT